MADYSADNSCGDCIHHPALIKHCKEYKKTIRSDIMAYKDLREFIAASREKGDVIEVDRPIDCELEAGKAIRKCYAKNAPMVIFKNPIGKAYPMIAGVFGNREHALRAFETDNAHIMEKFTAGIDNPIDPVYVTEAPCQEVVEIGDEVDLTKLPIPHFNPSDGGPFITAGITVSKDPETGATDIGHFRYMLHDKNTLGWFAQPFHRFGKNCGKAKAMGKDKYEAAIVIGTDPVLGYTCQIKQIPDHVDDFTLAGGLRGEPVELVKCKTIDLYVPATAEFVIELEVNFNEKRSEGPLGEYTGFMTPASDKPVCKVKAITHRKDPLFQVLLTGKPVTENHVLKNIPFEASFLKFMKSQFPGIKDVSVRPSGGVQLYVVMSMKQKFAGEARHAIMAAMASNIRPKWTIVVDPDVDVHNSAEVEWAMSYRTVPGRDVFIINNVPSAPLDPSSTNEGNTSARLNDQIGVDATTPYGVEFPTVAEIKGWEEYPFPEID